MRPTVAALPLCLIFVFAGCSAGGAGTIPGGGAGAGGAEVAVEGEGEGEAPGVDGGGEANADGGNDGAVGIEDEGAEGEGHEGGEGEGEGHEGVEGEGEGEGHEGVEGEGEGHEGVEGEGEGHEGVEGEGEGHEGVEGEGEGHEGEGEGEGGACDPDAAGDEICDGKDNDCDGAIDEDFALGEDCTEGDGECAADGVTVCNDANDGVVCSAIAGDPAEEVCDDLDNDCDGAIDEELGVGDGCVVGDGECEVQGALVCDAETLEAVCDAVAGDPADEVCDGLDNDCDGEADNNIVGVGDGCDTGAPGICADGTQACVEDEDGDFAIVCLPDNLPGEEQVCNGIDENCNGDDDDDPGDCPDDGDVRLVDGEEPNEGRVEFWLDGGWNTICHGFWSLQDANVACRSLGFSGAEAALRARTCSAMNEEECLHFQADCEVDEVDEFGDFDSCGPREAPPEGEDEPPIPPFGAGDDDQRIGLDNMRCDGDEENLLECQANELFEHNCTHLEDAGVVCTVEPPDFDEDGIPDDEDNCVEIANEDQADLDEDGIGDVCDADDDGDDVLDFEDNCPTIPNNDQLDSDSDGFGDFCDNCRHDPNPRQLDDDDNGIGDRCDAESCPNSAELVGSYDLGDGPGFGEDPPTYSCREACAIEFGEITDNPQDWFCSTQERVLTCEGFYDGWGRHDCDNQVFDDDYRHLEFYDNPDGDAAFSAYIDDACRDSTNFCWLRAEPPDEGELRLIDLETGEDGADVGRLEIYANRAWGTVCDDLWTGATAGRNSDVACRQLGFDARRRDDFNAPGGRDPILLDNVECNGDEERLIDCEHNEIGVHNCNHGEDVGIACMYDIDADGVADEDDNCPETPNPRQADFDEDDIGDLCDLDADGDGFEAGDDDCDDLDPEIHIAAEEICDDDIDNDCDDAVDDEDDDCAPPPERGIVLQCGRSSRDITSFFPAGSNLEIEQDLDGDCQPGPRHTAVLISRHGSINAGAFQRYLAGGGNVLTEFNVSHTHYSAIFAEQLGGENIPQGQRHGSCRDNISTVFQHSPEDGFWQDNEFVAMDPADTGCAYSIEDYPDVVPLAGWTEGSVSLAYRDWEGGGRMWLVEADWQDPNTVGEAYAQTEALMGYMITWIGGPRDADEDGVIDDEDNCPDDANEDQADWDEDGIGDVCDNCRLVGNEDQADEDEDGEGDACEFEPDFPGVLNNISEGAVEERGWTLCWDGVYGGVEPLAGLWEACTGGRLMYACKENAQTDVLRVAANALREDVIFDTGESDEPHVANGVGWYYADNESMGFAAEGSVITRNSCDTQNGEPEQRLCWHTRGGDIRGGYRCGARTGLNADQVFIRQIWQMHLDDDDDGVLNPDDNCPDDPNDDQADWDDDGIGDVCDNCRLVGNEDQADEDEDGEGDACEFEPDFPGVRNNLTEGAVEERGWTLCWDGVYGDTEPLVRLFEACQGDRLMYSCKENAETDVLRVAANAAQDDVLFDTGNGNDPHNANGVGWYFSAGRSMGFAPEGEPISRNSCDTQGSAAEQRICWHTGGGNINGGWRCGAETGLNGNNDFIRQIWVLDEDDDDDGVLNPDDNCPDDPNDDQADWDDDGIGDVCDNCRLVGNEDQADEDEDGEGDACEFEPDFPGVLNNISEGAVEERGWTLCWDGTYGGSEPLAGIWEACQGRRLMYSCKENAETDVLRVAANGPRADVLFDTGNGNDPHNANGVGWYYSGGRSIGFAPEGEPISRNSCDTQGSAAEQRICWHTGGGNISGGWRCGAQTGLNGNNEFIRQVWQMEIPDPAAFEYTGARQEWVVPLTGRYLLELWGAQGGTGPGTSPDRDGVGGFGGEAWGEHDLIEGEVLIIYVGGAGSGGAGGPIGGGYNGGGAAGQYGGSGGGASDIRVGDGGLQDRVIVAGGAGGGNGGSPLHGRGGDGGGLQGADGITVNGGRQPGGGGGAEAGGAAGTNGAQGALGAGASSEAYHFSGGGGGWFGGGNAYATGSGGGSSYYAPAIEGTGGTNSGVQRGNGRVVITHTDLLEE